MSSTWLESLAFQMANADIAFDNLLRERAGCRPLLPLARAIDWRESPRRERYLHIAATIFAHGHRSTPATSDEVSST